MEPVQDPIVEEEEELESRDNYEGVHVEKSDVEQTAELSASDDSLKDEEKLRKVASICMGVYKNMGLNVEYENVVKIIQSEKNFLQQTDKTNETLYLYACLDDKNRTISALKQRLMNQQLQLAYYLHKNLGNNSVTDFSSQCTPQLTEENMNLSLAMYKFVKDNGGKNKLNILHEKLQEYDERVSQLLAKQEELVKNASKNCLNEEIVKEEDNEFLHADRACRIANLDLYSRIMNATVQVKKELEELRQYSEKIVQLENERNALVDYVFSLPPEQRLNGLNLIENMKTQKFPEIVTSATSRMSTSTVTNENPKFLGHQLTEVLSTMENEAVSLVSLNEEQRNAYIDELEKLRTENIRLSELLITADTTDSTKVLELEEKCERIQSDLQIVRKGLEVEVTDKDTEIVKLKEDLGKATEQYMQQEDRILDLKSSLDNVVFENEQLNEQILEMSKQDPDKVELEEIIKDQQEQIKNLLLIICNLNEEKEHYDIFEDSGIVSSNTNTHPEGRSRDTSPEPTHPPAGMPDGPVGMPFKTRSHNIRPSSRISSSFPQIPKAKPSKHMKVKKSDTFGTITTTSLRAESCDPDGKMEVMRAVLESSSILDGVLEMDNSSKLKLRLRCSSPTSITSASSKTVVTLHDKPDFNVKEGISQQLDNLKREMDLTLRQPNGRKNIINNIKYIYSQLFGDKADNITI